MQNMPDRAQLMQLIQSPEGQKLMALLRNADSAALTAALSQYQRGNPEGAKQALSGILSNEEIKTILSQLGR